MKYLITALTFLSTLTVAAPALANPVKVVWVCDGGPSKCAYVCEQKCNAPACWVCQKAATPNNGGPNPPPLVEENCSLESDDYGSSLACDTFAVRCEDDLCEDQDGNVVTEGSMSIEHPRAEFTGDGWRASVRDATRRGAPTDHVDLDIAWCIESDGFSQCGATEQPLGCQYEWGDDLYSCIFTVLDGLCGGCISGCGEGECEEE